MYQRDLARNATAGLLLAFLVQARAKDAVVSHTRNAQVAGAFADRLAARLIDRTLEASSTNHAGLDNATLGKPGDLAPFRSQANLAALPQRPGHAQPKAHPRSQNRRVPPLRVQQPYTASGDGTGPAAPMVVDLTRPRGSVQKSDPAVKGLVADASSRDFVKLPLWHRAGWYAIVATMVGAIGATETVPVSVRLLLASLLTFSNFEYCFHRWVMHAQDGSRAQRIVGQYQNLHVTHHRETLRDMQLEDGADSDPRHIYFSKATTLASVAISAGVLQLASAAFHLGFEVPPTIAVSALVALAHTSIWQTLHGDIHDYYAEYEDGLPPVGFLSTLTPYTQWVITNHVGHHVLRGQGNYNIVFPGPDYLWGTAYRPKRSAESRV